MCPDTPARPARSFQLVRLANDGSTAMVALSGDIDISNAKAFRVEFKTLAGGPATSVTLDVSACRFIDSTGIYALILAGRDQLGQGRRLALAGLAPRSRRVLELAGLLSANLFTTQSQPPPETD